MGRDPEPASIGRRTRRVLRRAARRVEPWLPGRRPERLPAWNGPASTLPPIIVGGTGLSGTSVTARMLGEDPGYHAFPFEVKFISNHGGLTDLVAGRTSIRAFERHLLGPWFRRVKDRGLNRIASQATLRAAVRELAAGLDDDPVLAARRFTYRLLDPSAVAAGKRGWVDSTPNAIRAARGLLQILPEARLVHMVRDGRDVACSLTNRTWGPTDAGEGLRWWARHLASSFEEVAAVGQDRVLTLRMEDLMTYDREASIRRLVDFLELPDDTAVRRFFEEQVTGERAHIGRWRTDVPAEAQEDFLAAYRELSAGLVARWGYDPSLIDSAPVGVPT